MLIATEKQAEASFQLSSFRRSYNPIFQIAPDGVLVHSASNPINAVQISFLSRKFE
jgi:hypothetical protein